MLALVLKNVSCSGFMNSPVFTLPSVSERCAGDGQQPGSGRAAVSAIPVAWGLTGTRVQLLCDRAWAGTCAADRVSP